MERAWLDARAGIAGTGGDHPAADPVRRAEPERRAGDGRLHRAGILVLHVHDGAVAAATAPAGALGATAIPRALVPWLPLLFASSCLGLFVSSTLYAGPARCWGCWSCLRPAASAGAQPGCSERNLGRRAPELQLELVTIVVRREALAECRRSRARREQRNTPSRSPASSSVSPLKSSTGCHRYRGSPCRPRRPD